MNLHRSNEENKGNGWLAASSKKDNRRLLKQQTRPAPKRVKKPIVWSSDFIPERETGQQQPSQKKAGTGNALRNWRHKLKQLEKNDARPRRIFRAKEKIKRLENDLEARIRIMEEKAAKEAQYFDDLKEGEEQ
jgi:hypothetical protein